MIKIKNVNAGYGDLKVLFDVSLEVNEGEVVTLVGSNGAGKTTLLRVISGLIPLTSGEVLWYDKDITKIPAYKRPELGIAHIPQGRGILGTLTVKENLLMGAYTKSARPKRNERIEYVFDLFPILRERANLMAGTLSGGQQQMLAIARALMMEPKLLILDEPSLGLAPIIVEEVFEIIQNIRTEGVSILLIEQNLLQALSVADRGYVFETGQIVIKGSSKELLDNPDIKKAYLGI
ncbi:MAG: branched-chain amino acid transport system ATP-binding protein [Clostridiales bacterium]|nr:branched-chain amino acid transport system ATP-binding protein [Clostridiales bacterium]MDK2932246.1 branched-chain amino acid transport system ATP-binding protein [Clostridiales bacterium]